MANPDSVPAGNGKSAPNSGGAAWKQVARAENVRAALALVSGEAPASCTTDAYADKSVRIVRSGASHRRSSIRRPSSPEQSPAAKPLLDYLRSDRHAPCGKVRRWSNNSCRIEPDEIQILTLSWGAS
jgi:hypothetical protein